MPLLDSFDAALAVATSSSAASSANRLSKRALVGGTFSRIPASPSVDWDSVTRKLISHSDGLCSYVYRCPLSSPSPPWPYSASPAASPAASSTTTPPDLLSVASAANEADGLPGWVCIKRVQEDEQPAPHSIDREIALLDTLPPHRNIVPLLAAIYDTSDPFGATIDLVMPLYAATLDEVLHEPTLHPELGLEDTLGQERRPGRAIQHLWTGPERSFARFAVGVAKQVLSALAWLHENGVGHRDVKPTNILLSHNGTVKVIDLGTAYSTTPLASALSGATGGKGGAEWEGGRMVCQVGTGVYRAPELLFSPTNGYDAFAVDVWAAGVTLAHLFTPLTAQPLRTKLGCSFEDERKDWQKAFDSNAPLASPSQSEDSLYWEEQIDPSPPPPTTASGYIRTPLFEADKGDIGLAASIFHLLGLPESTQDWPEAEHFQPPLHRLPFAKTNGVGLVNNLPLFTASSKELEALVYNVIQPALSLSAAARPSTKHLLAALDSSTS